MNVSNIKAKVKRLTIDGINAFGISSKYLGTPKSIMPTAAWVDKFGARYGADFKLLFSSQTLSEKPPITLDSEVHKIFRDEYQHEAPAAFVTTIPGGRVWGRNGTVISPNDVLLSDVSREFGAYGGIMGKAHSVNRRFSLHKCAHVSGRIAVLGTAGTYNYHHWLYDNLARVHLLKLAGVFESIDKFVVDFNGLSFQKEGLKKLGIPESKILSANDNWRFHIEADELIVPSLPSKLGRVGVWPVQFLRDTFLEKEHSQSNKVRLYISRRKAVSRKVVNEAELISFLETQGFVEFFPEDHSIVETAAMFANADYIVGVHGSGFANLAFISPDTKVIDIVAPQHLDPYYWMLTNRNNGRYGYLFGEGERAAENKDLVAQKIDHDILIDMNKLKKLFAVL